MNEIKVGTIIRVFNTYALCISVDEKHKNVNFLGKITELSEDCGYAFNFLEGPHRLDYKKKLVKWFISPSRLEDGTAEVVL